MPKRTPRPNGNGAAESTRHGEARRREVPRSSHADWKPKKADRSAFQILRAAAVDRVPHLLQLKYDRMAASPFGYFRGAVPVMAYDLAREGHTGICNQLCGDAHVRNLGAYAGLDGRLVFDLNDFDETVRGPFEWDVKRLATSIHLAGREAGESEAACRASVRLFLRRYRKSIHLFASLPILELARYQIHRHTDLEAVASVFARAERSTPGHLRDVLTQKASAGKGTAHAEKTSAKQKKVNENSHAAQRYFRSEPPLLERLSAEGKSSILQSLEQYKHTIEPERRHLLARYRAVDVCFKVVGTGSVGLRDYCVYFEGNGPDDPLFLQVKQEVESAWQPYLPADVRGGHRVLSQGERVVNGQRAMQVQSDPFIGYTTINGRDYLVRQLNDHKGSVNLGTLDVNALSHYADLCGEVLARGHARSGDPLALAGYVGHSSTFDKAIADFARHYADRTEQDWKELRRLAIQPDLRSTADRRQPHNSSLSTDIGESSAASLPEGTLG